MPPDADSPPAPRSTRRTFLRWGAGVTAVGAAATLGYTFLVEPFWWQAVHLELPIANLPTELVGRTLVQISDLHVGPRVDEEWITKSVKSIEATALPSTASDRPRSGNSARTCQSTR